MAAAEKPLYILGEAFLELTTWTAPELAELFQVQISGWGAELCRDYLRGGGHAALLSQLGADPFGRKIAAQLASDGIDCSHLCFTDAARTSVVFSGDGEVLPYRSLSAELHYAPEQLDASLFQDAFGFCFSSAGLLDAPIRMTHLKAIAAARDYGVFVCYAPRMAESSIFWPDAAALRETASLFFPQADVLLLKSSDLFPLFGSDELRTALFPLFSGHVQMIFYADSDQIFLFTRNAMVSAPRADFSEADFLHRLCQLALSPDELPKLRKTTLKKLLY